MSNDISDFIDSDFQSARQTAYAAPLPTVEPSPAPESGNMNSGKSSGGQPGGANRPPSREEIEQQISANQQEVAKLKRAQEEKQRELSALEEMRRRQAEFQNGREEMLQHLTRGIGLLEDAEMSTRREADQMARSLAEFRDAVAKVQALNDAAWTRENLTVELTKALTTIENARMEWNSARLKFSVLNGAVEGGSKPAAGKTSAASLASLSLGELCKIGLGLTWPLAALGMIIFLTFLLRR
jgi:TolA-binding protein